MHVISLHLYDLDLFNTGYYNYYDPGQLLLILATQIKSVNIFVLYVGLHAYAHIHVTQIAFKIFVIY